jgi:hypothetical protein
MDARTAARRGAEQLLEGEPSPGDCERAGRLLAVAGDGAAAARAWSRAGAGLEALAARAGARGDAVESVQWLSEAADMYAAAGDAHGAMRAAVAALADWPQFEEAKRIVVAAPAPRDGARGAAPRLRRLPGSRFAEEEGQGGGAGEERPLPSMFQEAHGRLLRHAGREAEAARAFEAALTEVEREVARRRREQQWQEALAAARTMLRLAYAAGGRPRLDQARPEFVSIAREAAVEALTPEYFARGHDEVPSRAMGEALLEAHALGNEAFAVRYEEEHLHILERTAELIDVLRGRRPSAEALLSSEHEWPMVSARPGAKERLLRAGEGGGDLVAAMGMDGLAATHPLRAEVQEFAARLDELVGRAQARAAPAFAAAALAAAAREPRRAVDLSRRAVELAGDDPAARLGAMRARRAALQAAGLASEAHAVHAEIMEAIAAPSGAGGAPADLQRAVEQARFEAPGDLARGAAARGALSAWHRARGAEAWQAGDGARAAGSFEAAVALGDEEATRWLEVLSVGPPPRART